MLFRTSPGVGRRSSESSTPPPVAEIAQPIVDGRGGEHEKRLWPDGVVQEAKELVIARRLRPFLRVAPASWITEVVSLVNHHHIGEFRDATKPLGEVSLAAEVRVA